MIWVVRGFHQQRSWGLFALALSTGFVGCQKAQTSNTLVCDRDAYVAQSREYAPGDGEGIRKTKSAHPVVTGYFGKLYNQDWLAAVGYASIDQTLDYVRSTGVNIYHANPISTKSALPFDSLPPMPDDIDRTWHSADKPVSGSPCGFLAGLYLGKNTRGLPSLESEPAIIVREDASRWTLVHEFMHHNFKTQAALHGYDDEATRNLSSSLLGSISALKHNRRLSDREYTEQLASAFDQLIDVTDKLVVQYQFEEVAVEATLQDRVRIGRLSFVSAGAYDNATWYINHSRANVEALYDGMTKTYSELTQLAAQNGAADGLAKVSRYPDVRDLRLAQLDAMIAQHARPFVLGQPGKGFAAAQFDVLPAEGYAPCAQARAMEDQIRAITDLMRTGRDGT
jgi:hypothetical protein